MDFKQYWFSVPVIERAAFADRCESSEGYLTALAGGFKNCGENLAIRIERESRLSPRNGEYVTVEEVCPGADWAVIRGKPAGEPAPIPEERAT